MATHRSHSNMNSTEEEVRGEALVIEAVDRSLQEEPVLPRSHSINTRTLSCYKCEKALIDIMEHKLECEE
jgi:hypothetical protein